MSQNIQSQELKLKCSFVVGRKANINVLKVVLLQTLAANLGSSFTPMGNPQNLFIYYF